MTLNPTAKNYRVAVAAYEDADRTIELRRRLHRHPEIGLHLPRTQAAVLEAFAELPLEVTTGRRTSSVVGVLRGARLPLRQPV